MKRIFASIIIVISTILSFTSQASERLTAVLQHGDTPLAFYGEKALTEAIEAASAGDLITLSRGTFTSPGTINKAVKIQGIGTTTKLSAKITISIPDGQTGFLLEGLTIPEIEVKSNLSQSTFKRCTINIFNFSSSTVINCQIIQCNIINYISGRPVTENLLIDNCIINSEHLGCDAILNHCVITSLSGSTQNHSIKNSIIKSSCNDINMRYINVIFNSSRPLPADAYQENTIGLTGNEINALFASTTTYELTPEAAARYIVDGSQIGAYGGSTPYTLIPAIPQIKSASVPATVDSNGKITISFTVEAND